MVRASLSGLARLPLEAVVTVDVEALLDAGVLLTEEQIDFLHHPEDRYCVAVYGVPDPDRLYIAGPDSEGTLYQIAPEGEPADANGYQAVVLPVVLKGEDQEALACQIISELGGVDDHLPVVHGIAEDGDWMWRWAMYEIPITVACWDLWPIEEADKSIWQGASYNAFESSRLPQQFELIDIFNNGSEYYGDGYEDLQTEQIRLQNQVYQITKEYQGRPDQDALLESLPARIKLVEEWMNAAADAYVAALEEQITHPATGGIDAQMPPMALPPEQAAIWRSLQSLSWRNWSTLKKSDPHEGNALYGSRFVEANRRLCPWY